MDEIKLLEYLRKVILSNEYSRLKDGTQTDWELWLDPLKIRDKTLPQIVKLFIKLEILIPSKDNDKRYTLHKQSSDIAYSYIETNTKTYQIMKTIFKL